MTDNHNGSMFIAGQDAKYTCVYVQHDYMAGPVTVKGIKIFAQGMTTLVVKAKLHDILRKFPDHDLSKFNDREEIATAIISLLGGAIENTVGLFKGKKDVNPFF